MDWVTPILQGFIGSLVATAVAAFIAYLTRMLWFDKFQTELVRVYKRKETFLESLKNDIMTADSVKILSMRGEVIGEEIDDLLQKNACKVTVVISSLNNNAIEKRRMALGEAEDVYKTRLVQTSDIYKALGLTIGDVEEEGKIRLKFHKHDISSRLIFVDDCVYVSVYPKKGKINDTEHAKYKKKNNTGRSAYTAYEHYFNSILKYAEDYAKEENNIRSFKGS